jgi:hypothetical protein
VRLFETASGKEQRQLPGPRGWMYTLAFSLDDTRVFLARQDGALRAWETATGKEKLATDRQLPDGNDVLFLPLPPFAVFSADGMRLASAENRVTINLTDTATGKVILQLENQEATVNALALSADGKLVASARRLSEDGKSRLQLWETATGKPVWEVQTERVVERMAFSPDSQLLALAGSGALPIEVRETVTGKALRRFTCPHVRVQALVFAPDGKTLASAGDDATVMLWNVAEVQLAANVEKLDEVALGLLWRRVLGGDDAAAAYRAVCTLAAHPQVSVPFLKTQLRPAPIPDLSQVGPLLEQLGSKSFDARQKAMKALEKLGEAIEPAVRQALAKKPALEVQRRLEQLLEKMNAWTPEWARTYRALQALERMGTLEARQLIEALAAGAPGARLTREAEAVKRRLDRTIATSTR